MQITLHKNATTTPAIRKYIQENKHRSTYSLMKELHLSQRTILRWKNRSSIEDKSSRPKNMHTTISWEHEQIAIILRKTFLLTTDDLLYVVNKYLNPKVSRSGISRLIKRNSLGDLNKFRPEIETKKKPIKKFKDYAPGYIHIDVKYLPKMPDESKRSYLFVAIDRCTRYVHLKVFKEKTAKNSVLFLKEVISLFPGKIKYLLTDNGKEFTDKYSINRKTPSGKHILDILCKKEGIEHRLSPAFHPQTNGMVERFNRRISELLRSYKVMNSKELNLLLLKYKNTYDTIIKQKSLGWKTPEEKLKEYFNDFQSNLTGLNKYR